MAQKGYNHDGDGAFSLGFSVSRNFRQWWFSIGRRTYWYFF